MKIILSRLSPFFLILLLLLPFIFLEKGTLVLYLNQFRTSFWDNFFINASILGNAICVPFAMLLVLRFRMKWVAIFVLSFLVQIILVLLFKKGFYAGALRPYLYFKHLGMGDMLTLIEGVKIRYVNTFPSGHTATIFFLTSFFALLSRNKTASWVLLGLGLIVGLSRVYLIQHFFIDVYFGILFGTLSSVVGYYLIKKNPKKWHAVRLTIDFKGVQKSTGDMIRQIFNI
ncbi:MAG: phosphatase PAP2 family protein [Bacteroidota bacterium]